MANLPKLLRAAQSSLSNQKSNNDIIMVANTMKIFAKDAAENVQTIGDWINANAPGEEPRIVEYSCLKREYVTSRGEVRTSVEFTLSVLTFVGNENVGCYEFSNDHEKSGVFPLSEEDATVVINAPVNEPFILWGPSSYCDAYSNLKVGILRDAKGDIRYRVLRGKRYAKWFIVK